MKNTEIDNKIVKDTTFELQNFRTLVELEAFQKQIQQQKEETEETEVLTIWDEEISINFYNGIQKTDVINLINSGNFEDKEDIIDFLKEQKIKELQHIIWWDKGDSGYENLPKYWDDWKFGNETFDALEKYIEDHPKEDEVVEEEWNNNSVQNWSNDSDSDKKITVWSDWEIITTSQWSEITVNKPSAVETWNDIYGWEDHYELELNNSQEITIKSFPNWTTMDVMPSSENIKINEDWKLEYSANFVWEETFRVRAFDKRWKEIYNNVITIDVKWDEDSETVDQDGNVDQFAIFMQEIESKNNNEKALLIWKKISEEKERYLNLMNHINSLDQDDDDYQEKFEKINNQISDIEDLVKKLMLEEFRSFLIKQINDVKAYRTTLERELNDEKCTFHINWEDITEQEFLDMLESGKLSPSEMYILDLQLDFEKLNKDYLNVPDKVQRNYYIENLVISDDPNYMNSNQLTKDQEIQYNAESVFAKQRPDDVNNRQAIKKIVWMSWFLWLGGIDEDLSVSTLDYKKNNPVFKEKQNLKKLKRALIVFTEDDNKIDVWKVFDKITEEYSKSTNWEVDRKNVDWSSIDSMDKNGIFRKSDEKHIVELWELYTKYMNKEWWDYFIKVMWMLDNHFVKWIDVTQSVVENNWDSMFQNIYKEEHIWRLDWLIDPDKKRQAIKSIFKKDYGKGNIKLDVRYQDTDALWELEKITKKIDLVDMMQKINLSVDSKPDNLNKWEDKFYGQYIKYKNSIDKKEKDGNWNYIVEENNDYYNAVFDLLVWIWEGRQTIVEAVNTTKLMDNIDWFTEIEERETEYYDNINEKKLLMLLSDLNFDGRNDFGDRWMRMWLELKNIYKSVKIDQKYLDYEWEQDAWKNIIDFVKDQMSKNGQTNLAMDLENKWDNLEDLLVELKNNPWLLKYMQGILINSPIPVDYIFRHGIWAAEQYFMPQIMSGNIEVEWLDQKFELEYRKLLQQWLKDTPELRSVLKPMIYGAVVENGGIVSGAWGVWLSLNTENSGTFSLSLGYGQVPGMWENWETAWVAWVMLSWSDSQKVWENTDIKYWVAAGSWNKEMFIPIASGNIGIKNMINSDQLDENLKPKSAKYFDVGANVTMIGVVPSWWLSAWFSQDKMKWIEKQYQNIEYELRNDILPELLSWINLDADREIVIWEIQASLSKRFVKSDEEELKKAAINIYRGISYYGLEWVLDSNDPRFVTVIDNISKNYALMWRNEAIRWANKLHIERLWVGVQFLAGFVPIPIVSASVAWYKNLYSSETEESIANYYAHLSTGRWMRYVESNDGKEFYNEWKITSDAVDYLNSKMNIAHQNIETPDLDIKISVWNMEDDSVENTFMSPWWPSLCIPKELYKYVNINIDPDIMPYVNVFEWDGKVWNNGVEYIEVPLNTKISLLDYSRTNTARFNLIIWDIKAETNDIKVNPLMMDPEWNPTKFESIESLYMKESDINTQLEILKEKEDNNGDKPEWFPIADCEKVEDGFAVFNLEGELKDKCVDMWWSNSDLRIEDGKLYVPEFGSLTVHKNGEWKFEMYYRSLPKKSMKINYSTAAYTETTHTRINQEIIDGTRYNFENYSTDFSDIDVFDKYNYIDEIFEWIEKDLSEMDDNHWEYATFMKYAFDSWVDDILDEDDYDSARDSLKKILEWKLNNSFLNPDPFEDLRKKMEDNDVSDYDKVMIVDRFKWLFSYHPTLSDWDNDWKFLENLVYQQNRSDVYMNMFWYDQKTNFPLKDDSYRREIVDKLKNKDELNKPIENNLFWMTAFYRHDNKDWRWYSMTQMWFTNVLGGHMEEIKSDDLESTKEWFWNNLNVSEVHKEILLDSLNDKINIKWLDLTELSDDNLKNLLTWEYVDIGGENDKIKTELKLDLNYVFYLLWECANESIGIKLESIELRQWTETETWLPQDSEETTTIEIPSNTWGIEINPQKVFEQSWMYVNTIESQNQLDRARKHSVWAGFAFASGVETPEEEYVPDGEANANNWANDVDSNNGWNDGGSNNGWNDSWWSWGTEWWSWSWSGYWNSENF